MEAFSSNGIEVKYCAQRVAMLVKSIEPRACDERLYQLRTVFLEEMRQLKGVPNPASQLLLVAKSHHVGAGLAATVTCHKESGKVTSRVV